MMREHKHLRELDRACGRQRVRKTECEDRDRIASSEQRPGALAKDGALAQVAPPGSFEDGRLRHAAFTPWSLKTDNRQTSRGGHRGAGVWKHGPSQRCSGMFLRLALGCGDCHTSAIPFECVSIQYQARSPHRL